MYKPVIIRPATTSAILQALAGVTTIFTDLDGTVINPASQSVEPADFEAWCRAHAEGLRIIPMTGRAVGDALAPLAGLPISLVGCFGGAAIFDTGSKKFVHRMCVPKAVRTTLQNSAMDLGLTPTYALDPISTGYNYWHCGDSLPEAVKEEYDRHGLTVAYGPALPENFDRDVLRCDYHTSDHDIASVMLSAAAPVSGGGAFLHQFRDTDVYTVEASATGAHKGTGAKMLMYMLNQTPDRCIGVGDGQNDIPLFEACLGCAMGNAKPEVADAATLRTGHVERSGFATLVESILAARSASTR